MSILRQVPRFIVILAAVMLITGCSSWINRNTGGGICSGGGGSSNRQAPIVCVDDTGPVLSVNPDPVTAHNHLKNYPSRPVTVRWATVSGADLWVEMKEEGCVQELNCSAPGSCTAVTIPGASKQCKYDVWTTPTNRLDPIIIVTPCCI